MAKAFAAVFGAFLLTILAAKTTFLATSEDVADDGRKAWAQNRMEFVAWNNERWTAWIHEDSFEQLPENTNKWSRHANTTIAFMDWDGEPWQAKVAGDQFELAHRGDWQGEVQSSAAIRYRDWQGKPQLRTVDQLRR